jgi:PAS domain S-box-containing protein
VKKILAYINPMTHIGERDYPVLFPALTLIVTSVVLEMYVKLFLHDPNAVGLPAITIYIGLIVYFAFRLGIRGGFVAVFFTILYYLYIIWDRQYAGAQLVSGLETTAVLTLIYSAIAFTIGWLKERIDWLLDREITERMRLMTVIQKLPVGVLLADQSNQVIVANGEMSRIVGKKITRGMRAMHMVYELYSPQTGKLVSPEQYPLHQALKRGKTTSNQEMILATLDGKKRTVLVTSAPILDTQNNIVAGVSICQDVTLVREIESRKDDFVSMASHELKTPITSLKLFLTLVQKRLIERKYDDAQAALVKVERQIGNLMHIITNLLDVSRYRAGKMLYTPEKFRLDKLVEETVDSLQGISHQRVVIKKRKNLTLEVFADRHRINQVLANLITNAYKYSDKTSDVVVTLTKNGTSAEVSVMDKGIGIPRSQHKKIFDRLYQIPDRNKNNTYPGFGMGLYISKEIIRDHKGRIWVDSVPGEGSTFHFTLPLYT